MRKNALDVLLEQVEVLSPGEWNNSDGPSGWYAVANTKGIVAYFSSESAAFFFRLALINATLNDIRAE